MLVFRKRITGRRIIGDPNLFSLEERIFNTICVIAFFAMCFEVPFNFFIGLMVPAGLCFFGVFFSAYLFYISRFKRKSSLGIRLFCFTANMLFAVNYFFNSGIFGPNLLLFVLVFLVIISIIPTSQYRFWITINIITILFVLIVEYLRPEWVPNVYQNELTKALDFGVTYLVVAALTYFSISYIRKNYDVERGAVLEKNQAIEQQKLELERLNSEKNKMFSIVTHDIRTPLSSIQGYLELLTEVDLEESERLELKKHLLQITRDTSAMLTNVLTWSKTQMDGSQPKLEAVDICSALANGLSIERSISLQKGVSLAISCEGHLEILADRQMLQLVIRNLVNNAIKFTEKGGRVQVRAYRKDNQCYIHIKDNGLGISLSQQETLFQLNTSSTYGTNNEKGIGLGLLLCWEFTIVQGGEIWFENNLDQGSSFFLRFQLAKL